MSILHITETLESASGVATFVRELNEGLRAQGVDSRVWEGAKLGVKSCELGVDGWKPDIIHIHGVWLGMYHKAVVWARENSIPVVWSTHGMTAPWSMRHKWWKKLPAWWLYQKWDLKKAAAIHCTTELEVEWNRRLGLGKCFVVPLGTTERFCRVERVERVERVLLFVGRIYPVKGLENLIRAWALVVSRKSLVDSEKGWKVRIVGPDQAGHRAELEKLIAELGVGDSVEFAGPKFGEVLSQEYENCDCLVLPSFTENFGATVVDAMAHGKPVITSTFTPWREVRDHGCGWWVSNEPKELAKAIKEVLVASHQSLVEMGERGRKLVEEKYTWPAVVKAMVEGYGLVVSR